LRIARADADANPLACLDQNHFSPGPSQRPGHRQPDHTGPDHHTFDIDAHLPSTYSSQPSLPIIDHAGDYRQHDHEDPIMGGIQSNPSNGHQNDN
jgi:hypothetical protein